MAGIIGQFPFGAKPEEEITVTPSASTQVVLPSSGKTLSKVTVNGITGVHGLTIDGESFNGDALSLHALPNAWVMASKLNETSTLAIQAVVFDGKIHVLGCPDDDEGSARKHMVWNGTAWETLAPSTHTMDNASTAIV